MQQLKQQLVQLWFFKDDQVGFTGREPNPTAEQRHPSSVIFIYTVLWNRESSLAFLFTSTLFLLFFCFIILGY